MPTVFCFDFFSTKNQSIQFEREIPVILEFSHKVTKVIPEMINSIENTIAIAILSTIAITIAIDKGIFQLLLLLLIRDSLNYPRISKTDSRHPKWTHL